MKYFGYINYIKTIEYDLNVKQGLLMEIFLKLSSWAKSIIIDGEVFYSLAGTKVADEVPLLFKTKKNVVKNINTLIEKGLIIRKVKKNKSYYQITSKGLEFEGVEKSSHKCLKKETLSVPKSSHYNNTIYNNINIKDIIDFLNKKTNKNFKYSDKTVGLIKTRINDGFIYEDFKKVIDIKSSQWIKNNKMKSYLRPETLFSNKFEGYLNEYPVNTINENIDLDNLKF